MTIIDLQVSSIFRRKNMEFEPHEYQAYSIDYIITYPVATLFLNCGLGKKEMIAFVNSL